MIKQFLSNIGAAKLIKPIRIITLVLVLILLTLILQSALIYQSLVNQKYNIKEEPTVIEEAQKVLGANIERIDSKKTQNQKNVTKYFDDVPYDHISFNEIHYLKAQGIIDANGKTFNPDKAISRAESIALITKAANIDIQNASHPVFKDITPQQWFYNVVNNAYSIKMIDGFSDGTFRPDDAVTQAGFLKILFAAYNEDVSSHTGQNQDWHVPYIEYAYQHKLISEKSPWVELTRAEAADILYRFLTM